MGAGGSCKRRGYDVAEEIGAAQIAEGHTVDDQAETVLMGADHRREHVRTGGDLAGGRFQDARRVQPLIDVTRDEVEAFCRALRLRPRRDPTNEDTDLLRNAIRKQAIPALERATRRNVRQPLARVADEIRPIAIEELKKITGKGGWARGRRGEWLTISERTAGTHRSPLAVQDLHPRLAQEDASAGLPGGESTGSWISRTDDPVGSEICPKA